MPSPIPNRFQLGKVLEVGELTPTILGVRLRMPAHYEFAAGQYVWLVMPNMHADDRGNRRAFSIASAPNSSGDILLITKKGSSAFKQALVSMETGAEVEMLGPFGQAFTLHDSTAQQLVMVAGGVGVAPFLSVLLSADARLTSKEVTLVYSVHQGEKHACEQELQELAESQPWFHLELRHSRFSFSSISNQVKADAEWWVCGPQGMIDSVFAELTAHAVLATQIKFEQFYPTKKGQLSVHDIQNAIEHSDTASLLKDDAFYLAVDSSSNHIIITDINGSVLYANPAAQAITGYSFSEMQKNTPRLWGGLHPPEFYEELWRLKLTGQPFTTEITNRRKNGELYQAIAHISPIHDTGGMLVGFVASEEDISDRIKKENELKQKNSELEAAKVSLQELVSDLELQRHQTEKVTRRLQLATASSGSGVWEWNVQTDELVWDELMYALHGVTQEQFETSVENWQKLLHPEDADRVIAEVQSMLAGKESLASEYRIVLPDRTIKFVDSHAIMLFDEEHKPKKLIGIQRDITREKEIDRLKSEFVSMASHQLRTPLATIRWYSELLLDQCGVQHEDDPHSATTIDSNGSENAETTQPQQSDTKEYIDTIYTATRRMIDLVNGLLNISRIELGTFTLNPSEQRIQDIARWAVTDTQEAFHSRQIELQEFIDDSIPPLQLDKQSMHIILLNLLSNAAKYSHQGSQVQLWVRYLNPGEVLGGQEVAEPSVLCQVSDAGIGIPSSQTESLFKRLFRADNAQKYESDGTGLGLYIIKSIVDTAGGQIWFETKEGEGSSFFVAFPLSGMKSHVGSKKLQEFQ